MFYLLLCLINAIISSRSLLDQFKGLLFKLLFEKMKTLHDLCLTCIGENLNCINRLSHCLATVHKEMLLERLSYHSMYTPAYLPSITYNLFCSTLRHIKFAGCQQITNNVLKQLGASGCKLHTISLERCNSVGDVGLRHITYDQTELESLELDHLPLLTDRALSDVQSKRLKKFTMINIPEISGSGIRQLTRKNPGIGIIKFRCTLEDEVFVHIATELNAHLTELDASFVYTISDATLEALGEHCPNLLKLNIDGSSRVSHVGFQKLWTGCTSLSSINVSYCTKLSDPISSDCLQSIPVSLRKLSLCGVGIRDAELLANALGRLPMLESLKLSGVPALCDDTIEILLERIGASLELFDITGSVQSQITDQGLALLIKHCTKLTNLGLGLLQDGGLTCTPLIKLFESDRAQLFTKLQLSIKHISYNVLLSIPFCRNLENLNLSGVGIVDDICLIAIAENCPNLTCLNIKSCVQVTDDSVCEMARYCSLRSAVLSGLQKLTDKTIFALANGCPYLEQVYLNGCSKVTTQAVNYLLDCCLTSVYVQHKIPNVNAQHVIARNLDTGEYMRMGGRPT